MFLGTTDYLDMTSSIQVLCLHSAPCVRELQYSRFRCSQKVLEQWEDPPPMCTEEGQIFFLIILVTIINIHFPDKDYGSPALSLCCFSQPMLDLSFRTDTHPLSSH